MARPRAKARPATIRVEAEPAKIGPLLREAGFVGCEQDPVECSATWDGQGNPRIIRAYYKGGWRCEMRLLKSGGYSLSQSVTLTIKSKAKGS